jgi:hypothetical protein
MFNNEYDSEKKFETCEQTTSSTVTQYQYPAFSIVPGHGALAAVPMPVPYGVPPGALGAVQPQADQPLAVQPLALAVQAPVPHFLQMVQHHNVPPLAYYGGAQFHHGQPYNMVSAVVQHEVKEVTVKKVAHKVVNRGFSNNSRRRGDNLIAKKKSEHKNLIINLIDD